MRFHKRTKENMRSGLEMMITSDKQTIAKGIRQMTEISIDYVDLNKACSLLVAYWSLNSMTVNLLPEELIRQQAELHSERLEQMLKQDMQDVHDQLEAK